MKVEELLEHLKMIEAAQADYEAAKIKFIEEHCPYRIGDRITLKKREGDYYICYEGKDMIIESITMGYSSWKKSPFYYRIFGTIIKKDGTAGKQSTTFEVAVKGE